MKDRFRVSVNRMLENHFDIMTSSDTVATKVQRDFILRNYNEYITAIRIVDVRRVAKGAALCLIQNHLWSSNSVGLSCGAILFLVQRRLRITVGPSIKMCLKGLRQRR